MRKPATAAALALASIASPGVAQDEGERPNVVLLLADDLGWGDVGFLSDPPWSTPELDAWAAEGVVLERFYAAAPVCSPTRGSCLSGRHPLRYGIPGANAGHLPADEPNLAALLRARGYRTGHFGKWHLGTLSLDSKDGRRGGRPNQRAHFAPPWERGFDVCFSTEQAVPTWDPMIEPHVDPTRFWVGPGASVPVEELRGSTAALTVDRALSFVAACVDEERPFLCVVWFHAPHAPVVASPEALARRSEQPEGLRHYAGVVEDLDRQIGRLRRRLEQLGLAESTLVFFASDNGPEGTERKLRDEGYRSRGRTGPLRGRKRSLLEGGTRVPAFAVWPGRLERGTRCAAPLVTSDYLPTVLAALSLPAPPERAPDGLSIWPLLRGERSERGRAIGFESGGQVAWTGDRYKLYRPEPDAPFELYDLLADPGESRDLAAAEPEVLARLQAELEAWRSSVSRDAERR